MTWPNLIGISGQWKIETNWHTREKKQRPWPTALNMTIKSYDTRAIKWLQSTEFVRWEFECYLLRCRNIIDASLSPAKKKETDFCVETTDLNACNLFSMVINRSEKKERITNHREEIFSVDSNFRRFELWFDILKLKSIRLVNAVIAFRSYSTNRNHKLYFSFIFSVQ